MQFTQVGRSLARTVEVKSRYSACNYITSGIKSFLKAQQEELAKYRKQKNAMRRDFQED